MSSLAREGWDPVWLDFLKQKPHVGVFKDRYGKGRRIAQGTFGKVYWVQHNPSTSGVVPDTLHNTSTSGVVPCAAKVMESSDEATAKKVGT